LLLFLTILGNIEPDYHFRCRLFTGYSQPNDSWKDDFSLLNEDFVDGLLLYYHRLQGLKI